MMVIFLDFDGVLHPFFPRRDLPDAENQLFSFLPRLETVLRDFAEVKIVISSSWREHRPWAKVIHPFSPDIAARIIGATPIMKGKVPPNPNHPRYAEILDFLNKNGLSKERWVALDDDADIYPEDCQSLIVCADGFREAEEIKLREILTKVLGE